MPKGKTTTGKGGTTYAYPLGQKGEIIGTPGVGTHSFTEPPNNWESDNAVDIAVPKGTDVIAVADGTIGPEIGPLNSSDPRMEGERFHLETKGNEFYYAHLSSLSVHAGQKVKKGDICGRSGEANGVEHLHFACENGNPEKVIEGEVVEGVGGSTSEVSGQVTGTVSIEEVEAAAKGAAFSTYFEIEGLFDGIESEALKGQRSLMNDKPLLSFIEQLCQASLRRFQSMPNGNFYAFYPDYFGGLNHHTPYWEIHDIEILDGKINLNDEALATHVYVVGDSVGNYDGINEADLISSSGVCTLFHAMSANFITGFKEEPNEEMNKQERHALAAKNKEYTINFLKRYGARPFFEEAPMVRSGFYEMFLAFQRFCLLWSKQFLTEFELTYMPELFPGGLVALPEHGLQLFVEEVSHDFDYENGFTTTASFTAPTSLENGPLGLHDGMIRADALTPVT